MEPVSAAGIALSITSLSFQVFAKCVQGFVILSTAHNFGKDASFLRTMLNVEEYRFVQWADTVGLTSAECKILPQLNQALAEELIVHLRDRLDNNKLKERYSLDLRPALPSNRGADEVPGEKLYAQEILGNAVSDERRAEVLSRAKIIQSRSALPKRLWWATLDKSKFKDLVKDLRQIVDALWGLLEPIRLTELSQQVGRTLTAVIEMSQDLDGLRGLQASLSSGFPGEAILSTAVGLKIMREQLPEEGKSASWHTAETTQLFTGSSVQEHLEPLDRNLLKRPEETLRANGTFTAEYAGKPVLGECKKVHPRLKSKLKLRAENLTKLLSLPKSPSFLTLKCLGFLEDMDEFVFLYEYPPGSDTTTPPRSLQDLLRDSKSKPPSVTARLRLALEVCRTLVTVHTAGWLHKNIRSENIMFFAKPNSNNAFMSLEQPYLTGFTFSRADSPVEISDQASENPLLDIYRHPQALGEPSTSYAMYMDHYSLGTVLTEVAEWRPLKHIIKKHVDVTKSNIDVSLTALAGIQAWLMKEQVDSGHIEFRMGEVYGKGISWFLKPRNVEAEERHYQTEDVLVFQQFVNELSLCRV